MRFESNRQRGEVAIAAAVICHPPSSGSTRASLLQRVGVLERAAIYRDGAKSNGVPLFAGMTVGGYGPSFRDDALAPPPSPNALPLLKWERDRLAGKGRRWYQSTPLPGAVPHAIRNDVTLLRPRMRLPHPAGRSPVFWTQVSPHSGRIWASIFAIMSGFFSRNCLAFSRPWPIRSPL